VAGGARPLRRHARGLTTTLRLPALALVALTLIVACTGPTTSVGPSASPAPTRTPDIQRSKLDVVYSAFVDLDVHKPTSRATLNAAIEALKKEAKATGGKDDFPALDFTDSTETELGDFKKFADAASLFAARNPQISPDRFADVAIAGMISVAPDCHTSYINKSRQIFRSRPESVTGADAQVPNTGKDVFGPDANGMRAKVLPNGVAYVTFRQWQVTGTDNVVNELRKALDAAVAAGAIAWLFDLRGNPGGNGADAAASWFLNGEQTLKVAVKTGNAGTSSANKDLRLPQAYQLPIAVVVNARSASATEVFAATNPERYPVIDERFDSVLKTTTFSRFATCSAETGGSSNQSSEYASSEQTRKPCPRASSAARS